MPEDAAVADYEKSTTLLAPHADYLVVNVSSPNTPGLRDLQAVEKLEPLLRAVRRRADDVADGHVPLLVKIAPDLADDDVLAVGDLARRHRASTVSSPPTPRSLATASTPQRPTSTPPARAGSPVHRCASVPTEVVRLLRGRVGPDLTLIGVGGISTPADARARLDAGADLLQAYTAFVYEGPLWPRRINEALCAEGMATMTFGHQAGRAPR